MVISYISANSIANLAANAGTLKVNGNSGTGTVTVNAGATLLGQGTLAGAVTVMAALLVGVIVGRWVFKMHPGVLLGVCAGACTATPALAAMASC